MIGDHVKLTRDFSSPDFPISLEAGCVGAVVSDTDQFGVFMANFFGIVLLVDSESTETVRTASTATRTGSRSGS